MSETWFDCGSCENAANIRELINKKADGIVADNGIFGGIYTRIDYDKLRKERTETRSEIEKIISSYPN